MSDGGSAEVVSIYTRRHVQPRDNACKDCGGTLFMMRDLIGEDDVSRVHCLLCKRSLGTVRWCNDAP